METNVFVFCFCFCFSFCFCVVFVFVLFFELCVVICFCYLYIFIWNKYKFQILYQFAICKVVFTRAHYILLRARAFKTPTTQSTRNPLPLLTAHGSTGLGCFWWVIELLIISCRESRRCDEAIDGAPFLRIVGQGLRRYPYQDNWTVLFGYPIKAAIWLHWYGNTSILAVTCLLND